PAEALDAYERARAIFERSPPSYDTTLVLNNLGEVELDLNATAAARRYFEAALRMGETVVGPTSALYAVSLWGLGEVSRREERGDEALGYSRRALPVADKAFGAQHPQVARPLLGIGRVLLSRHQAASARAPLQRALAIRDAQPGDGVERAAIRLALAQAL